MKVIVALVAAIAVTGGAYLLGESTAANEQDAQHAEVAARRQELRVAFAESAKSSRTEGRAKGKRAGVRRGSAAGNAAGKAAGKKEAKAQQEARAQQQASTWPSQSYQQCAANGGQVGQASDEWLTGAGVAQCVP